MTTVAQCVHQRELYLTPDVKWFLVKCGTTETAALLVADIFQALNGKNARTGIVRVSAARTFLLFIAEPIHFELPERVIVWSGVDEGRFFTPSLFDTEIASGLSFQ